MNQEVARINSGAPETSAGFIPDASASTNGPASPIVSAPDTVRNGIRNVFSLMIVKGAVEPGRLPLGLASHVVDRGIRRHLHRGVLSMIDRMNAIARASGDEGEREKCDLLGEITRSLMYRLGQGFDGGACVPDGSSIYIDTRDAFVERGIGVQVMDIVVTGRDGTNIFNHGETAPMSLCFCSEGLTRGTEEMRLLPLDAIMGTPPDTGSVQCLSVVSPGSMLIGASGKAPRLCRRTDIKPLCDAGAGLVVPVRQGSGHEQFPIHSGPVDGVVEVRFLGAVHI